MVVLPEPARPCTATVQWGESRIVRAASHCPGFRPAATSFASPASAGASLCPCVQAGAHAGDDVPFGFACPVGDEGQVRPSCRHLDQVPVAPQLGNGGVKGIQRVPPGPVGQRPGTQVVGRQYGAPLLQMLDSLPHHRQRRRMRPRLGRGHKHGLTATQPTP